MAAGGSGNKLGRGSRKYDLRGLPQGTIVRNQAGAAKLAARFRKNKKR